ncbi:hypothetical protein SAMN02982929_00071 [Saccharopolyspora kobensis]|uniref:Uncharacterized protein n=1 Tax=Saccharopolyspora kobensis TaxID=146035 RepID=A0A1H5SYB4_9PSEU|nr:hypothetical protein [Saccharopolyspora kobensis]SEF55573.1 hypothetical protein SAMN02982929_00071 [Saccharopolyspora kobensis]SFC52398.1 hypothetical protein SAMN05216506_101961 [Saccharopolyspora kobensis]
MTSGSGAEEEFERLFHLMEEFKAAERRRQELLAEAIQVIRSLIDWFVVPRVIESESSGERRPAEEASAERGAAEESSVEERAAEDRASEVRAVEEGAEGEDDIRDLRGGEKRMIGVLVGHRRLTRSQLATLSVLSPNSGTFSTYLSRLRSRKLITIDGDGFVALTERGRRSAGVRSVKPLTKEKIRNQWLSVFRGGARRMLEVLLEAGSVGLSRDELARKAGLKPTSGTYSTYLAKLRDNGLIEVVDGRIRVTEIFGLDA